MQPEVTRTRSQALWALVTAALVLSGLESLHAWAERWFHAPQYFALSLALTLATGLMVGLGAVAARLRSTDALALWVGLCLGLSWGWPDGLCGALIAGAALRSSCVRSLRPTQLGTITAFALALAYLKGEKLAEHLGQKDVFVVESISALALLGAACAGLVWLLARLPAPARWAVPGLLGSALALTPRLERGDGEHRQPPSGYATSAPRAPGASKPNVFLLVLDTVRADHLQLYGYARDTMPALTRRVEARANAVVFPRAFANGTWTVPSHASLFTGELPNQHGAHFALDGSVRLGFGIADRLPTLAERMQTGGYATLAGYANHWLRSVQGLSRGFERYLRAPDKDELPFVGEVLRQRFLPGLLWEAAKGCARADAVNATLLSLIEPWSAGPNPLFVFANYVDAHGPYAPPAPFRGRFAPSSVQEVSEHLALRQSDERHAQLMARYDEELLFLDHELERLFRALDERGLFADSWIFITSDHGEAFGEHGVFEHGTTVHNEVAHVPLIVLPPTGVAFAPTRDPVSLVDVAATIAAIGGVELGGPGRDLRTLVNSGSDATVIEFYGDPVKAATLGQLARRPARAVVLGHYKLIAYQTNGKNELSLFDLEKDPGENVDLAEALPHLAAHMVEFLPEFGTPTFRSDRDAPTPEALDHLRGLGYVGGVE